MPIHILPLWSKRREREYVNHFFFFFYNHYDPDGAFKGIILFIAGFGILTELGFLIVSL